MKPIDVVRSGHIKRWSIVRVHRDQTIAEHMYQVAVFAEMFAREIIPEYNDEMRGRLLHHALLHDIPEVMSGDLPTPVKRRIDSFGNIGEIDKMLDDSYWGLRDSGKKPKELPSIYQSIIKLADLTEALLFLEIEGVDQRAKVVQGTLFESLLNVVTACQEMHPQINWVKTIKMARSALNDIKMGRW